MSMMSALSFSDCPSTPKLGRKETFLPDANLKNTADNHFDKGSHPAIAVQENIKNMIAANVSVMQLPGSQVIIDSDIIVDKPKTDAILKKSPDEMIHNSRLGTLYTRLAPRPALYRDKGAREEIFAGSKWQSISADVGCWICNASKGGRK